MLRSIRAPVSSKPDGINAKGGQAQGRGGCRLPDRRTGNEVKRDRGHPPVPSLFFVDSLSLRASAAGMTAAPAPRSKAGKPSTPRGPRSLCTFAMLFVAIPAKVHVKDLSLSTCSLPRLRERVGKGPGHLLSACQLAPSPILPRARGQAGASEQAEFPLCRCAAQQRGRRAFSPTAAEAKLGFEGFRTELAGN
jgi:hypothetical protein